MSHLYRRNDIYWLTYYKNSKRHFQSLKTKDRTTALYLKSKIEKEVAENKYIIHDPNIACMKVLEEYEKFTENRKIKKTILNDTSRIKAFLEHGHIEILNQVNEKRLQEFLNDRISKDKISLSSANRYISTIRAWLNFAVRRKYIFNNPIDGFDRYKLPQNPPKFLSKDNIEKILIAAKPTRLYLPIITALYTGMRFKELLSLEWPDIDFNSGIITVKNKEGFTTKSKKFRTIPLHDNLRKILFPLRLDSGRCFDLRNYRKIFPEILKNAKVKRIGFHHFRHSFASYLCLNGVDLYAVSQLLGHSDIRITQIYAHLTRDHMKTAVDKLQF